jgi:hypothetical protein
LAIYAANRSILTVERALGPKIRAYASTGRIMIAVNRPKPSICSLGTQSNAAAANLMT